METREVALKRWPVGGAGTAGDVRSRRLEERLAWGALVLGVLTSAAGPLLVRASEVGPAATAFYRFTLALPILWLVRQMAGGRNPGGPRGPALTLHRHALAVAGLCLAFDLFAWHWALGLTSVANAALLGNMAPVFVTAGLWLVLGRRPAPAFLVALAVILTGATWLVRSSRGITAGHVAGDGLALLAAAFYAGYILATQRALRGLPTVSVTLGSTAVSAVALLPLALATGERVLPLTATGWLSLGGLALLTQVGGQGLFTFALGRLPAGLAAAGGLLQPVVAASLAWLVVGEAMSLGQVGGGALVLIGLALARRTAG